MCTFPSVCFFFSFYKLSCHGKQDGDNLRIYFPCSDWKQSINSSPPTPSPSPSLPSSLLLSLPPSLHFSFPPSFPSSLPCAGKSLEQEPVLTIKVLVLWYNVHDMSYGLPILLNFPQNSGCCWHQWWGVCYSWLHLGKKKPQDSYWFRGGVFSRGAILRSYGIFWMWSAADRCGAVDVGFENYRLALFCFLFLHHR